MPEEVSYVLLVDVRSDLEVSSRSRTWTLNPGLYSYVGSAKTPRPYARVLRHLRRDKRVKWHVDLLTSSASATPLLGVLAYGVSEDQLYAAMVAMGEVFEPAAEGFGTSDRSHLTHLFRVSLPDAYEAARTIVELALALGSREVEVVCGCP